MYTVTSVEAMTIGSTVSAMKSGMASEVEILELDLLFSSQKGLDGALHEELHLSTVERVADLLSGVELLPLGGDLIDAGELRKVDSGEHLSINLLDLVSDFLFAEGLSHHGSGASELVAESLGLLDSVLNLFDDIFELVELLKVEVTVAVMKTKVALTVQTMTIVIEVVVEAVVMTMVTKIVVTVSVVHVHMGVGIGSIVVEHMEVLSIVQVGVVEPGVVHHREKVF